MTEERTRKIERVTIGGAVVNIILTAAKLAAGLLGRSSAMIADAVHSLTDLISDVIILVLTRISAKGKDVSHDYGHGKFETLATVVVAILLLVVGAELMAGGVGKINDLINGKEIGTPSMIALYAAIASVMAKEILYQWTARVGRKVNSPAVITNAWHHRTDALSSVAAALGIGFAIALGGKWVVLDPIVCCAISIFIIFIAVKMAVPAIHELTEGSLPDNMEQQIIEIIQQTKGIENVHNLKTRRSGPNIIIDAHLVVNPEMTVAEAHEITELAENAIFEEFGAETQISLHVEPSIESK